MRRVVLAILLACLLASAGCLGSPADAGSTETPTETVRETPTGTTTVTDTETTTEMATMTDAATADPATTAPVSNATIEYVVRKGDVPPELETLNVSFEVAFVEHSEEVENCYYPAIFGENEPTPTPLTTPEGNCLQRADADDGATLAVDLTEIEGNRSLGSVTGPIYPDGGQALLVVDATARHENGTRITGFYDTTFVVDRSFLDGSSGETQRVVVEVGAQPADAEHADWAYELTVDGHRASSI